MFQIIFRPLIGQQNPSKFKSTAFEAVPIENFLQDNLIEPQSISSSQLANLIQKIMLKLVLNEHITTTLLDTASITIHCLEFCLENLQRFNLNSVFEEADQDIVRLRMLQLLFECLNNLFVTDFDDLAVMEVFKKIVEIGKDGKVWNK